MFCSMPLTVLAQCTFFTMCLEVFIDNVYIPFAPGNPVYTNNAVPISDNVIILLLDKHSNLLIAF